jgi:hypothetical protein
MYALAPEIVVIVYTEVDPEQSEAIPEIEVGFEGDAFTITFTIALVAVLGTAQAAFETMATEILVVPDKVVTLQMDDVAPDMLTPLFFH